jgi:hypothetical protein
VTQTHIEADDVQGRLAALGLNEGKLTEIVRRGNVAFASCTPNDPPSTPVSLRGR